MILVVLIFIYYSNILEDDFENKSFKRLLIINYLSEFLYLCVYISTHNDIRLSIMLSKLYLSNLVIYSSLLVGYIATSIFKNKYKLKDTIYTTKINLLNKITIGMGVISLVIIYLLPINIIDNMVVGAAVNIAYLLIFIYSIINFVILFTEYNEFGLKKFKCLFIVNMINVTGTILQYSFNDIAIINASYILITLYMYLTLENSVAKELENLKLEKDSIDKSTVNTNKFLTNMSYEIRTPLNAINGLSQVIAESDDIDNIKEDAKDIRTASKNLVDIINGIIDISTIETGKMEIINENYDVYSMLENVCNIAKSRLKNNDVEFRTDIAKNIPNTLYGDAIRLEQVLLNLLTNSIKYTEKGYILFKVDVINSPSLCRLKMTVSDTGIGFKEDEINSIFERSITADKGEGGNSLGLVIVKKLVELMNGKIDVESTYKKGTTFVVTIDQKVVNILKDDTGQEKKQGKLDIFTASSKRILIVDDNKLNLKVASKLLNPYKLEIVDVMSGQECLDILEKDTNFDLILMDDKMPNMSGTETLGIILKLERLEGYHIPIVVLTANAISGMKEKYLNLGFDDYLAKPIDKYELNRVLKKFLKDNKKSK